MADPQVTRAGFVDALLAAVPETSDVVAEHFADFDELLLHLLMADLLRFAVMEFAEGREEVVDRLLAFISHSLESGDEAIENAVAVSFVEHVGAYPGESPEFIARFPQPLLDERDRQLNWRPSGLN